MNAGAVCSIHVHLEVFRGLTRSHAKSVFIFAEPHTLFLSDWSIYSPTSILCRVSPIIFLIVTFLAGWENSGKARLCTSLVAELHSSFVRLSRTAHSFYLADFISQHLLACLISYVGFWVACACFVAPSACSISSHISRWVWMSSVR